jgi:Arc/MetJ-type ribon-helix-helix transcriptional regulator
MVKKGGRRKKPPVGSIPTYIRFTESMLKDIDNAAKKWGYLNASEFVREAVRLFIRGTGGMILPGKDQEFIHDGKPTYIRFTETQLDLMDSAVVARKFLNRSEFARDAVEKLLSTTNPATNAR